MRLNRIILPIVMLVASTQICSMDGLLGEAGRAASRGINIGRAEIPVALMNNNHVFGEHQTNYNMGHAAPYDCNQSFFGQMGTTFMSGVKESVFSCGNFGEKVLDYSARIGASMMIEYAVNYIYKLWNSNPQNQAEQEAQKRLAILAAHGALLQSIAAQLRGLPRLTEEDKVSYAKAHQQYASMFRAFTQEAHDYMQARRPMRATEQVS